MDETLIHVNTNTEGAAFRIPIKNKSGKTTKVTPPIPPKSQNSNFFKLGVHYRPFMKETLNRLKKDWELIIFTASAPEYANRIINAIDPDNSIFNFRLYRDNCYLTEKGIYIKDLRIL